jgi:hypothetical protein
MPIDSFPGIQLSRGYAQDALTTNGQEDGGTSCDQATHDEISGFFLRSGIEKCEEYEAMNCRTEMHRNTRAISIIL